MSISENHLKLQGIQLQSEGTYSCYESGCTERLFPLPALAVLRGTSASGDAQDEDEKEGGREGTVGHQSAGARCSPGRKPPLKASAPTYLLGADKTRRRVSVRSGRSVTGGGRGGCVTPRARPALPFSERGGGKWSLF